jgi:hypothetical protein
MEVIIKFYLFLVYQQVALEARNNLDLILNIKQVKYKYKH